jgi:hypothetical protein
MDTLVEALGPIFVASFALQQLIELLDPLLNTFIKSYKELILIIVALVLGLCLSFGLGLMVLAPFGYTGPTWIDGLITALMLTGGTKWINELLKVVSYKKVELHARAQVAERQMSEG